MRCLTCQSENDEAQGACVSCGQPLVASAFPTLIVGTVVASRYEIVGLLGKGGMGMVFKAKDRVLDEVVALKILRPDAAGSGEMARRFRNEIKLARKVRHKNVCGIHEYNEAGSLQYIAMEYVEGIDLKRLLRERGGLPAPEAFDVALQLAQGLDAIHDVGIIHRDLKTANAMIDDHGIVRLMDFGIAKKLDAEASLGSTAVGHVIGTPEYMSPEQARGEKIDFRSDIYGLGVMIFELFTGRVPFQAETPIATIFKHLQEPPPLEGPAASAIPRAMVPVLACCLAKDPEARYPSAGAVVEALRAAQLATCPEAVSPAGAATRGLRRAPPRTALPPPAGLGATPLATPATPPASTPQPGARLSEVAPTVSTATPPSHANVRTGTVARAVASPPTRMQISTPTLSGEIESPGRRSTAPLFVLGGVAFVGAMGLAVLAGLWLWPVRPQPKAPGASGTTPSALSEAVTPEPAATVAVVAQAAPSRPAAMPSPKAAVSAFAPAVPSTISTPRLTLRLDPSAVTLLPTAATPHPAAVPTPAPVIVASSEDVALLDVTAKPIVDVIVDGEPRGQTPLKGLRLRPGQHAIVLTNPDYQPFRRKLTLGPGQRRSLDVDLSWDGVQK